MTRRLASWARRFEDSWAGDLVGAACLFGAGYILFALAGVLS